MAGINKTSEWHEQVEFSELYFSETMKCRAAQKEHPLAWVDTLLSKIAFSAGVMEKEDVDLWYKKIDLAANKVKKMHNIRDKKREFLKNMYEQDLVNTLRNVEYDLDTKINKKMPFLNIKKKADIRGL